MVAGAIESTSQAQWVGRALWRRGPLDRGHAHARGHAACGGGSTMGAQPPPILRTTVLWIGMDFSQVGNCFGLRSPPIACGRGAAAGEPELSRSRPGRVLDASRTCARFRSGSRRYLRQLTNQLTGSCGITSTTYR